LHDAEKAHAALAEAASQFEKIDEGDQADAGEKHDEHGAQEAPSEISPQCAKRDHGSPHVVLIFTKRAATESAKRWSGAGTPVSRPERIT
jgi:hypothetical protein